MVRKNLWRSTYTGKVYEMDMDWVPRYEGWELIGTITKNED